MYVRPYYTTPLYKKIVTTSLLFGPDVNVEVKTEKSFNMVNLC